MEDIQSEFRITRSAIADLHEILFAYRDQPIEAVAGELHAMLDRACREARNDPDRVSVVHDTVEGDYHRQIYQLQFAGTDRPITLLGVVADDYDRRTGRALKVLITVIGFRTAKRSILSGRWRNPDGTPIRLPSAPSPAPLTPPTPAPALLPTIGPGAALVPTIDPAAVLVPAIDPAATLVPTIDPVAPSPVPIGSDGRPKRGYRRGGTTTERDAFVLEILRREPEASATGRNGIHERVRERFGVGMREAHVGRLRAQLAIERAQAGLAQSGAGAVVGGAQELVAVATTIESALGRLRALMAEISRSSQIASQPQ